MFEKNKKQYFYLLESLYIYFTLLKDILQIIMQNIIQSNLIYKNQI